MRSIPAPMLPLFHRIRDGHPDIQNMAYYLEYVACHLPLPKLEPALRWLIKNNIVGDRFLGFVRGECKNSPFMLLRVLTTKADGERGIKKLYRSDIK